MPYTATFYQKGWPLPLGQFDVTPEIEALGGAIPRADSNGTDMLHLATNAPQWVKQWHTKPFFIYVEYTDEAVPIE